MFFLLPHRDVANSAVNDFKQSLSQYNELNFYTVPLCNFKNLPKDKNSEIRQDGGNELSGLKSTHIKKSNPAIKSKPANAQLFLDESECLKCDFCEWTYPKAFLQEDKDSHYERCRNGYGEGDKKLWTKCKSDRVLFRKRIEAMEETRNRDIENEKEKEREREREREREKEREREDRKREREREIEIERRREEEEEREREKTKKGNKKIRKKTPEPSVNKNRTQMELEIDSDSDFDFDIPIPKKSHNRPLPNQGISGNNPQNLKRQTPSQIIEIYDLERDDLKKVKKSPIQAPGGNQNVTRPMIGRKSVTKSAYYSENKNYPQEYIID